jgi:ABC-type transport system involved in multi-copper enzyme maturation permease subunit
MSLEKQRLAWVIVFVILVLAAFIIPFTPLLSDVTRVYGAFMFWSIFAIVVIVCIGFITSSWGENDES